ncbi:hypothetical protein I316_02026 [Kwoniella heveanensis BCC8398]|uniref:Uncharacterized protein n=1 Tax=Kwoniella heveanensis BCC8398 TaxID=1296120 RepID=A0A1B9GYP6_9TREE|nr:hypothetical protein I316_02026 [Kwoniella heveanensis BCC8398]
MAIPQGDREEGYMRVRRGWKDVAAKFNPDGPVSSLLLKPGDTARLTSPLGPHPVDCLDDWTSYSSTGSRRGASTLSARAFWPERDRVAGLIDQQLPMGSTSVIRYTYSVEMTSRHPRNVIIIFSHQKQL